MMEVASSNLEVQTEDVEAMARRLVSSMPRPDRPPIPFRPVAEPEPKTQEEIDAEDLEAQTRAAAAIIEHDERNGRDVQAYILTGFAVRWNHMRGGFRIGSEDIRRLLIAWDQALACGRDNADAP